MKNLTLLICTFLLVACDSSNVSSEERMKNVVNACMREAGVPTDQPDYKVNPQELAAINSCMCNFYPNLCN